MKFAMITNVEAERGKETDEGWKNTPTQTQQMRWLKEGKSMNIISLNIAAHII